MRRFSSHQLLGVVYLLGYMLIALLLPPLTAGCGVFTARNLDFNNSETGEDGQVYVLDDLEAIANDTDLTDDEKKQAFRDLGIEDEDLITALLTL